MDASHGSSSSSASIFPMPQIPALLFAPPPAAALPSSSLSLSSYSSSSSLRGHAPSITSFPILVLTVLGILAASVILLAYYVFVIRCCLTWHRGSSGGSFSSSDVAGLIVSRRGRRPQRTTGTTTTTAPADADAGAEPRGLEDAAIRALPAFSYRKTPANAAESQSAAPASECAVCLGEFEEGDRVRMLPACLHVFHLGCVDAWLQSNASCPLCRASADVAATLCRLPPLPSEEDVVVTIQVVVPGAEEDQDAVAPAAEVEPEGTGEKTKSTINVLPPRSMDGDAVAAGGEVHLQIQSILQRDSHSRTHDHDSVSGGGRV